MSTQLNRVENWMDLAQKANWSVSGLARECGVSVRTLQRYFIEVIGKTPKQWMVEQRQQHAIELLQKNKMVKEVAMQLGYKHSTHFSREFKKQQGFYPKHFNTDDLRISKCRILV